MKPIACFLILFSAVLASCGGGQPLAFEESTSIHADFSGERALQEVADLTALGPRPAGSETLERARQHVEARLAEFGWSAKRQTFTADTPLGEIEFGNVRLRFGQDSEKLWKAPVQILIGSHIDTKTYSDSTYFVGANDSGSSSGALIEIGRVLQQKPSLAERIELIFFDGEEAFNRFTETDGLYGSREYAKMIRKWPVRPDYGIVLDMIGDQDLKIRVPNDSPIPLMKALFQASEDLGTRDKFGIYKSAIIDDHVPLNELAFVPSIDIIDFDYPFWHTPGDTMDKLSAESLEIVCQATLLMIEKYLVTAEAQPGK